MKFDPRDASDLVERMPWLTRLLLRCVGRRLNRDFFSPLLNRAYERRVISSHELHELHHHFDPTQPGTLGRVRGLRRTVNPDYAVPSTKGA